jgi:hypothetical protein
VVKQFEYPQRFAEDICARIEMALRRHVAGNMRPRAGRLFIGPEAPSQTRAQATQIAALPPRYILASDPSLVAAHKAAAKEQADLLHCRNEGEFLVSYETPGGWVAVSKDMLTDVLGAGRDARIEIVPSHAGDVLRLTCRGLVHTVCCLALCALLWSLPRVAATAAEAACPIDGEVVQWAADYCMLALETDDEIAASDCIATELQREYASACAAKQQLKFAQCELAISKGLRSGTPAQCAQDPDFAGNTVRNQGVGNGTAE